MHLYQQLVSLIIEIEVKVRKKTIRGVFMKSNSYSCIKCSGTDSKVEKIRTTGSGLSRFLDLQNKKFAAVSCTNCGFTELYREGSGMAGSIVDLLTG
jgi:predicted nucleic-acid-binding Zn-ribbon protein